jgi:UDP-N-acetylglucosamine 2-epimerase (non-hydrolysing)
MILIAFGTRPEWIKIKPVVDRIQGIVPFKLLFTGQHTSLIDDSIKEYDCSSICIDDDVCSNRLDEIVRDILLQFPEDTAITSVMVQGDTTSAFAMALAAFHRKIPIIHLEAGLRTFDKYNPYPEEFNRTAISSMAEVHLCPTSTSSLNLHMSNPYVRNVHVVGNTVLDHLVDIKPTLDDFVLVTMHRRENHEKMSRWFKVINSIACCEKQEYNGLSFILPMHPNPNVKRHQDILKHVEVVPPMPHKECVDYISRCKFVITDSGGIQEEACFLKKKCIVCRSVTERIEGLGDFAFLCKYPSQLLDLFYKLKDNTNSLVEQDCPYGDGHSAEKIAEILYEFDTTSK